MLTTAARAQDPADQKIGPPAPANQPGLLFYFSGDHGFNADYAAGGVPEPNYLSDVKILPGGVKGSYLQCGNNQLLSYWAPGNIYAQRGTLSFYWRSRDPVDETEFPIFRVGYADHSSWDQVWLRIDYNGHGFDAFVTDVNLGRTRVFYTMPDFPKPDQWVHLTLTWDEPPAFAFTSTARWWRRRRRRGCSMPALDQFGPHSRIIGPTGVESTYSYDRGGDLDELRIYDRALSDDNVAGLARGETPQNIPAVTRSFANADTQKEWWFHYGWNRPGDIPAPLTRAPTLRCARCRSMTHSISDAGGGGRPTAFAKPRGRASTIARACRAASITSNCRTGIATRSPARPSPSSCRRSRGTIWRFSGGAFGNMTLLMPDVSEDAVRRSGLDGTTLPARRSSSGPAGRRQPSTISPRR